MLKKLNERSSKCLVVIVPNSKLNMVEEKEEKNIGRTLDKVFGLVKKENLAIWGFGISVVAVDWSLYLVMF